MEVWALLIASALAWAYNRATSPDKQPLLAIGLELAALVLVAMKPTDLRGLVTRINKVSVAGIGVELATDALVAAQGAGATSGEEQEEASSEDLLECGC